MAGGHQTTGERATEGTGAGADAGGGWINGRGNDAMTMLPYYRHLKEIFEQTSFWQLEPRNELVNFGNLCLAEVGREYLVYSRLSACRVALPREAGLFSVAMFNPRTGEKTTLPDCDAKANGAFQYPKELSDDWVFVLKKK